MSKCNYVLFCCVVDMHIFTIATRLGFLLPSSEMPANLCHGVSIFDMGVSRWERLRNTELQFLGGLERVEVMIMRTR